MNRSRPLITKSDLWWLLSRLLIVAVVALAWKPLVSPLLMEYVFNPENLSETSYDAPIRLPNLGGHKTGM